MNEVITIGLDLAKNVFQVHGVDDAGNVVTTLREKLVKIGAKVIHHGRYVIFQLAEVAVPRDLFRKILRRIDDLRPRPVPV